MTEATDAGAVASLWRYPVKSMIGEELKTAQVGEQGLVGDREYALLDRSDGKVATAKNPRKWPNLFAFGATLDEQSLRIRLPDGNVVKGDASDLNHVLSRALNRDVTLTGAPAAWTGKAEEYWPDIEGLDHRETVTDFALPAGTFFDCAIVHVLTTATLERLQDLYPEGRFEVQRFRPNIVVEAKGGQHAFIENSWIGRTLAIGPEVRLSVSGPCGRCVMTTLAQGSLPADSGILRTAVKHNKANVGVYASVLRTGTIRVGDEVTLQPA